MRRSYGWIGAAVFAFGCSPSGPGSLGTGVNQSAVTDDDGDGDNDSGDIVLELNSAFTTAIHNAGTSPGDTSRLGAILHGAVFDAVNGVKGKYLALHETASAPKHTNASAAAAQAGHDVLVALFPQAATFDALLATQLAAIGGKPSQVQNGVTWGAQVAADTLAWRATDGRGCDPAAVGTTCPNLFGGTALGQWRPVPPQPGTAAAAAPQYVNMVPWAMTSHDQFLGLYAGPPALDSTDYADSVNESHTMGGTVSARSADQTQVALFYADNSPSHWNKIANAVSGAQEESLLGTARIFARLNVAMADAVITVWNSKFKFDAWRPYHAIREPSVYNAGITSDPTWVNFVATPGHPEYGCAHCTVAGAASDVLIHHYGDDVTFTHPTETVSPLLTSTTRTTTGFSTVASETYDARVFGGMHFRFTARDSAPVGKTVGRYVRQHSMLKAHGHDHDGDDHGDCGDHEDHDD